jgi:hypothetical protein
MATVSNLHSPATQSELAISDEPVVRAVGGELPGPLGALFATIVVLVSLGLFIWSLIATWSGSPDSALPLFQVTTAGVVVSLTAIYAYRTLSYVVALIGAAAWLWVSVAPLLPFWEMIFQAITVTVMLLGVNLALEAVKFLKRPRF